MRQYLDLLQLIKDRGVLKGDRTGTGTISLFGAQIRCDLRGGFPLLTTKKMFTRGIIEELLWFIRGSTNVKELQEKNVRIWDAWAAENGNVGEIYGAQWRHWNRATLHNASSVAMAYGEPGRDQLAELIQRIKGKPDDRRLIVTAWNPDDVPDMALPCCHCFFQCWTRKLSFEERETIFRNEVDDFYKDDFDNFDDAGVPKRGLSLQMYQRSADMFLGTPFNIASYALLTHMIAQVVGMVPLEFIHTFGDAHIYQNHVEQVDLQLSREPKPLPKLKLNPDIKDIDDFTIDDIKIEGYECWPKIKAEVSV